MSESSTTSSNDYSVVAKDLSLTGNEGPVYGPLSFTVPAKGVTILSGSGGGGRTALALTIAGRMKPGSGELNVLGHTKRSEIRNRVAIAGVEQVDLLDRDVTVKTLLTEHLNWSRHWWSIQKSADQEYLETIAGDVFGPRSLPPLKAYVSELHGVDKHLLRMALALHPANGHDIELLVVDDLEQIHEIADQHLLLARLGEISRDIPVIVNAVNPLPEGLINIQRVIELDTAGGHIKPAHTGYQRLKKAASVIEKRVERRLAETKSDDCAEPQPQSTQPTAPRHRKGQ